MTLIICISVVTTLVQNQPTSTDWQLSCLWLIPFRISIEVKNLWFWSESLQLFILFLNLFISTDPDSLSSSSMYGWEIKTAIWANQLLPMIPLLIQRMYFGSKASFALFSAILIDSSGDWSTPGLPVLYIAAAPCLFIYNGGAGATVFDVPNLQIMGHSQLRSWQNYFSIVFCHSFGKITVYNVTMFEDCFMIHQPSNGLAIFTRNFLWFSITRSGISKITTWSIFPTPSSTFETMYTPTVKPVINAWCRICMQFSD